jgi:omega-amidase
MMDSLNTALLQADLHWQNPSANQKAFEGLIAELPKNVNLIVLPEMWATGFTMTPDEVAEPMDGLSVTWMQHMAKQHNAAVCGSLAIKEKESFYNRFIFAHPNGNLDTYDKAHPFTPSGEARIYKAGKRSTRIEFAGFRIRPLVCYDLRFPVFARNTDNYDVLICVANWPATRIQAWNSLLCARAIENMAFSIGVNRTGKDAYRLRYVGASAAYNALGDTLAFATESESVALASFDKSELLALRQKLPFLEDRDSFTLN